jgi:hypothetical protein
LMLYDGVAGRAGEGINPGASLEKHQDLRQLEAANHQANIDKAS